MGVYIPNKRLPSTYQEVTYIQSSGTQYFVVGSSFKTSYKAVIDLEMVTTGGNYIPLGALTNDASKRYGINAYGSYFKVISGGSSWSNTKSEDKNRHTFILNKSTATVDGTDYSMSYVDYTFSGGIGVFGYHNVTNDDVAYKASAKLYKLEIYDENGTLIYNLVPCYRKSDTEIGMYDLVNDTFYTNSGTGTFSKGTDITMVGLKNAYIGEYKEWQPGENLLAYYPLTADVYDHKSDLGISGTTYNLSFTNGSSNVSYGTNGLTATGKYLLRTSSIPSQTTYSTMLWCNRTSYTANGSHGPLALTEKLSMFAYLDNSSPNIGAYSWGGDGYVSSGVTMSNGTWYHLAYTTDGSTLTIYINGQAYGPYNYRLGGTYNGLVVGGTYYGSNAQTFIGTLGEVYIWNRIITAQEVADYYNQTKSNYGL